MTNLLVPNLSKQFLIKLHLFNDTQSHATFALQLLSSSCLIRWCYWLCKNKDLAVKEKNVLDKNVLHCVLILLATRWLVTGFYTIKFLPFLLLPSSRLSLCSSRVAKSSSVLLTPSWFCFAPVSEMCLGTLSHASPWLVYQACSQDWGLRHSPYGL